MEVCNEHENTINLIEMNGRAYVWDIEDWLRLRSLRILGSFVGNLAALSKQDRIAALPLVLLKEETTLLLEKGYVTLNSIPTISDPPTCELQQKSKEYREKLLSDQVEILKSERKREIASKRDVIVKGIIEKQKLDTGGSYQNIDEESILQKELNKAEVSKETALAIHLPTRDPWIEKKDLEECSWDNSIKHNIKYLIYKDLWERGYYITLGEKFGGDFLAYPGDPIKFHSFYIIICLENTKKLQMQDIVTYGRLGQSVKKTIVLSYLDDADLVSYLSIQWAGF